jgi:hypothetical protein
VSLKKSAVSNSGPLIHLAKVGLLKLPCGLPPRFYRWIFTGSTHSHPGFIAHFNESFGEEFSPI